MSVKWNEAVEKATLSRVKGDDKVSIIDGNKTQYCYLNHFYGSHWLEVYNSEGDNFRIADYVIREVMLRWIKEHKFLAQLSKKHKWLTLIEEEKFLLYTG